MKGPISAGVIGGLPRCAEAAPRRTHQTFNRSGAPVTRTGLAKAAVKKHDPCVQAWIILIDGFGAVSFVGERPSSCLGHRDSDSDTHNAARLETLSRSRAVWLVLHRVIHRPAIGVQMIGFTRVATLCGTRCGDYPRRRNVANSAQKVVRRPCQALPLGGGEPHTSRRARNAIMASGSGTCSHSHSHTAHRPVRDTVSRPSA